MKVACIQPKIYEELNKCYSQIENLLKDLLNEFEGCEIVCLPERWVPFLEDVPQNIQKERGEHYNFVKGLAEKYCINIISGAIWEKREISKKPNITCYYFNEK